MIAFLNSFVFSSLLRVLAGRMRATIYGNSAEPQDDAVEYHDDEQEMNLIAMERVSILFERCSVRRSVVNIEYELILFLESAKVVLLTPVS